MTTCWNITSCSTDCPARRKGRSCWHSQGGCAACPWAHGVTRQQLERLHRAELASLLERAGQGDQAAYEELLGEYGFHVKRLARGLFLQGAEPEDLLQEGLTGLFQAIRTYREEYGRTFYDYATLCIRNTLLAAVRKANRNKQRILSRACDLESLRTLSSAEGNPERIVLGRQGARALVVELKRTLSEVEYRSLLDRMEGRGLPEIGRDLGLRPKQVENALFRARRKAQKLLAHPGGSSGG